MALTARNADPVDEDRPLTWADRVLGHRRVSEPARARTDARDASEVPAGGRVTFPATVTQTIREDYR